MLAVEKYRCQRQVGWSDEAEVHSGPPDPVHGVPVAVKIRHGMGGPPRPDGNRDRFLRAVADQKAATEAGCRQIAPIFDQGHEDENAFYVTKLYQRSLYSMIQGRVNLDASGLHRLTAGALQALEELRARHGRSHGNLKPQNIFLDGKNVQSATVVLSDLALREQAGSAAADCNALGASLYQLVRGRMIQNFDWPIEPSPEWTHLGPQADSWRQFCNLLLDPALASQPDALAAARDGFKHMRRLVAAAMRTSAAGARSANTLSEGRRKRGWLAGAGASLAAAIGAAVLFLPAADSKLGRQFRSLPVLAIAFHLLDTPKLLPGTHSPAPPTIVPAPVNVSTPPFAAAASPLPAQSLPAPTPDAALVASQNPAATPLPEATAPANTPAAMPTAAPDATPPPPAADPGAKWLGYTALLEQLQGTLNDPATLEQPELLTSELSRLRDNISFSPVASEHTVLAFLKLLPAKIEATGDQPDLPPNLWTKEASSRQDDVQSVTYQWGHSDLHLQFNRVTVPGGNAPAFYLGATTVPVRFGLVLAKMAEADGKGPLSGATSVKGPVAWQYAYGNYGLRTSWMVLDNINNSLYANAGRPSPDSPMNGLSAIEAMRLARAAGCTLPTLAQWNAVLASGPGQQWSAQWQSAAKVRGPQWSAFARAIQAQHVTGAKLPNDQCFGDRQDLSAVTQTADQNLFFEPVSTRTISGYAHLIGNVGQYLVDDARNPGRYYFAGGSAECAPSALQSLTAPPPVSSPFLSAADGGVRLAAAAKGNGSDKNPALDKLKRDLGLELARVQKLQ